MSAEELARVKLITLLNVASGRNGVKRKTGQDWHEIARQAKKSKPQIVTVASKQKTDEAAQDIIANGVAVAEDDESDEVDDEQADVFKQHFAAETMVLSKETLDALEARKCKTTTNVNASLGALSKSVLDSKSKQQPVAKPVLHPRLSEKLDDYIKENTIPSTSSLPVELLNLVSTYQDLAYSRTTYEAQDSFRAMISLHAMSHINKTRSRILKNNEALAHAEGKEVKDRETRDQGFTRPKVLILLPLRNAALGWMRHLSSFSLASQIENNSRFQKDFSLPNGAVDKLATDERDADGNSKYPRDHRETFMGNIDDTFRVGMKVTRKSLKLYSDFYQSDLIIASPLGLRASIEKEKNADFLSSIEIVVAEQLDVMQMQNWEHVQFVFKHLNSIPKEAHGADFSRVKPWYLDGQAAKLRQTILMSAYETPEIRSLFNKSLTNVAGRIKTIQRYDGVLDRIRPGVKQNFVRFDASDAHAEDDARFEYFTTKTLPALRKSAVASTNTLIFIPSYFDFVRINAYLKTLDDIDFAVLSEYSSNSEISRARTNFFNGKTAFLLVTERFHFFRRYKIRGARTVVFYAPPEHADFYAEYLEYPFLKRNVTGSNNKNGQAEMLEEMLEAEEVSCQTVFSKYDFLKLERIVGTPDAVKMCKLTEGEKFTYV